MGKLFFTLLFCIGTISLFDLYLAIEHRDVIADHEENPIAKAVILSFGMGVFVVMKIIGTLVCLLVISKAYQYKRKLGWSLCLPIFFLQAWLLWYLLFAGP